MSKYNANGGQRRSSKTKLDLPRRQNYYTHLQIDRETFINAIQTAYEAGFSSGQTRVQKLIEDFGERMLVKISSPQEPNPSAKGDE